MRRECINYDKNKKTRLEKSMGQENKCREMSMGRVKERNIDEYEKRLRQKEKCIWGEVKIEYEKRGEIMRRDRWE